MALDSTLYGSATSSDGPAEPAGITSEGTYTQRPMQFSPRDMVEGQRPRHITKVPMSELTFLKHLHQVQAELEVARNAYLAFIFEQYRLDPTQHSINIDTGEVSIQNQQAPVSSD